MITKPIGTQEIVYATITDIVPDGEDILIHFKHMSGKKADHRISRDKLEWSNIYSALERNHNYVIVTHLVAKNRWVWRRCWVFTKKEMELIYKHAGLRPTYEQMDEALKMVISRRNPEPPKELMELLVF